MEEAPVIDAPRLSAAKDREVGIIGSSIAGLSTTRLGRSVVVIDRGGIGNGMTPRTTAHLETELDSSTPN
jgi:glycine/D-amino acid oxidase-like deaminating enzyme